VKVVGISGSLRAGSSNAAVLRAAAKLAPPNMSVEVWEGLGGLPHFNPDLDIDDPPPAVREFRELLRSADAVILCSPEYAHGMPGALKNALDWLVSDGTLVGKAVVIVTIAPTFGEHAHAQLVEVLSTMSWNVLTDASLKLRKTDDYEDALRAMLTSLERVRTGFSRSAG
jgi:NAD(P)H-dependent FMN reductase